RVPTSSSIRGALFLPRHPSHAIRGGGVFLVAKSRVPTTAPFSVAESAIVQEALSVTKHLSAAKKTVVTSTSFIPVTKQPSPSPRKTKDKFNPRFYVAAATDNMSLQKAQLLENSLADQILCNGLGTCISICAIAFLFKVLGIRCGQSCNNNILELPMLAVSYIDDILYTYSSGLSAKITRNIIGTRLLILEVFIHYSFFGGNIGRDGSCYPT
ncbi:hypothetical protein S83_060443, partial [Arachis hypogaea]